MVLTKEEVIGFLQHEIRLLIHLAGKIDPAKLDYRPTPKQRSTLELLRYMAIMGPTQLAAIKGGVFTRESMGALWTPAETVSKSLSFDEAVARIKQQADDYAQLSQWTEAEFRTPIDMFGSPMTKGSALVAIVLNAHAAYRMQLFLYLKSCGREELNTMNLWMGIDGQM
jgi:hypothetical protein